MRVIMRLSSLYREERIVKVINRITITIGLSLGVLCWLSGCGYEKDDPNWGPQNDPSYEEVKEWSEHNE